MSFVYWVATIMIALMTSATAQQTQPNCPVLIKPVFRMTQEWDGSAWKRVPESLCGFTDKSSIIEKEKERARQQQKQKQQQQDSGTDQ